MEETVFQQRTDLTKLNEAVNAIRDTVSKVIVGQHKMVDLMIAGLLSDGHILIEGVPGVAKTLSAKLLARIIDVNFQGYNLLLISCLPMYWARRCSIRVMQDFILNRVLFSAILY